MRDLNKRPGQADQVPSLDQEDLEIRNEWYMYVHSMTMFTCQLTAGSPEGASQSDIHNPSLDAHPSIQSKDYSSSSSPTRFSGHMPLDAESCSTGLRPSSSAVGTRCTGGVMGGVVESSDVEKTTSRTRALIMAAKKKKGPRRVSDQDPRGM